MIGIYLIVAIVMYSCASDYNDQTNVKPISLIVEDTLYTKGNHPFAVYDFKYVGIHYRIVRMFSNSESIINVTKDSLEVEILKRALNKK